jgi:hypothetical protein
MTAFELPVERTLRAVGAFCGALAALGCASSVPRPPHAPVELSETLPAGYESLGRVSAACRVLPAKRSFTSEPATSFACSESELSLSLVEQANARGGTLLAGESCEREGESGLVCSAEVARPPAREAGAARSAEVATPDDELLVSVANRIRIDVESAPAAVGRPARRSDDVAEFVFLPIGHVDAGVMRAHCAPSDCDVDQARAGLRLAAGALGASELVGVRCISFDGERTCIATLGVTERDANTDPRAR